MISWTAADVDGVEHHYQAAPHDAVDALGVYADFEASQFARLSGQPVSNAWMRTIMLGAAPQRFAIRDGKAIDEVTFRDVYAGRNMIELTRAAEGRATAEGFSDSVRARISDVIAAANKAKNYTQTPASP